MSDSYFLPCIPQRETTYPLRAGMACLIALFAAQILPLSALAEPPPSLKEIEKHVLSQRAKIKNAAFTFECEMEQNGALGKLTLKSKQQVWCVGETKIRIDEEVQEKKTPAETLAGYTHVFCQGCYRDGTIFEHETRLIDGNTPLAAQITDVSLWKRPGIPHALRLGLTPEGYLNTADLQPEEYFGKGMQKNVRIEPVDLEGKSCWQVTYERPIKRFTSQITYAVVPEEGWSVVHIERKIETPAGVVLDVTACTNQQDKVSGIWFPREVVYEQKKDAARLHYQRIVVTKMLFNQVQNEQALSLTAIPTLKPETTISRRAVAPDPTFPDNNAIWRGGQLVPRR